MTPLGHRLLIALAACSGLVMAPTAGAHESNKATVPEAFGAGEGHLLLKVVSLQPPNLVSPKWSELRLTERKTGRIVTLRDSAPTTVHYAVFAGAVPEGTYSITDLHADGSSGLPTFGWLTAAIVRAATSNSQKGGGEQAGTFTVKAAASTNLGVVVNALPATKDAEPQVAVLAHAQARADALGALRADDRERLSTMPALAWDAAPEGGPAQTRVLEMARTAATNVSPIGVSGDGTQAWIGGSLGTFHARDASGQWTSTSTGSLDHITFVRSLPDGRIVAGTDVGRYLVHPAADGPWQTHELPGEERLLQMVPAGASGYAFVTQEPIAQGAVPTPSYRVLLVKDLDAPAQPLELHRIKARISNGVLPLFFDGKELLIWENHTGMFRDGELSRVDLATLQKRSEKVDHLLYDIYQLSTGELARNRVNGSSAYPEFSQDNGASWSSNNVSGSFGMRFADTQRGYGFDVLSTGWKTISIVLKKSTDGGKTWTRTGKPIESASSPRIQLAGQRVFVSAGGQTFSTGDEGETWMREWPRGASPGRDQVDSAPAPPFAPTLAASAAVE